MGETAICGFDGRERVKVLLAPRLKRLASAQAGDEVLLGGADTVATISLPDLVLPNPPPPLKDVTRSGHAERSAVSLKPSLAEGGSVWVRVNKPIPVDRPERSARVSRDDQGLVLGDDRRINASGLCINRRDVAEQEAGRVEVVDQQLVDQESRDATKIDLLRIRLGTGASRCRVRNQ